MKIDYSKIAKTYSGRVGCMCGCIGKYNYNEGVKRESWQDPVNVRGLKIIAKKVLTNPNVVFEEYWAYVEDRAHNKNQVVYFVDQAAADEFKAALLTKGE